MKEDGVDISRQTSDNVNDYRHIPFDYIITVCDNAKERCPYFPSQARQFHQNFPDPAKEQGSATEVTNQFRIVRDQIKDYCSQFVKEYILPQATAQ